MAQWLTCRIPINPGTNSRGTRANNELLLNDLLCRARKLLKILTYGDWGIGGLGNLAFINKAVGLVNTAMIRGGRILRLTPEPAIRGVAEKEEIVSYPSFVLEKLLYQ